MNVPTATETKTGPAKDDALQDIRKAAAHRVVRVCHVSMCLKTGGLERLLVEFAKRTRQEKFNIQFATLGELGQPAQEIAELGFPVTSVNKKGVRRFKQLKQLASLFRRERIDIVHTHNTYAHFYGTIAARMAMTPIVVNSQHGRGCGPNWKARWQFRLANLFSDRVLGVSEDAAKLCQNQDFISKNKIEVLWNGIDLDRFEYHGPNVDGQMIAVARLSPEKDFGTLLDAIAIARKQLPKIRLQIVGDGAERSRLEKQRDELNLQTAVEFLGERSDVPTLLKNASFFVSSSTTEGISLTILEAMAVGLPIVTTNVGGNPEIVEPGKTGTLVESRNPQQLADAIVEMYRDKEAWPVVGEHSRQRVEQHFNVNRMIRDYEALYRTLMHEKHIV